MRRAFPFVSLLVLAALPIAVAAFVWLSPLAFVPVPWPDDSAFYFVAKELFSWPPRWVMLPQAPFEPTYALFNFNTMPLYPVLIGIGRFFGIDGSFALKLWPLSAWALSGTLLAVVIHRAGLHAVLAALVVLAFSLDPIMRWASVLVRPESLVGLCGICLVLGLTFGFPKKLRAGRFWDPVAALLAVAAYAHFNAIHLVFPVLFSFLTKPKRLFEIGSKTALYLAPWALVALWKYDLFIKQMSVQWKRLAVRNDWLDSPARALQSLFPALGSPEPWPDYLAWAALGLWLFMVCAIVMGVVLPLLDRLSLHFFEARILPRHLSFTLIPSAGWIIGAMWLWHSKPELWFVYYLHASVFCFTGILATKLWNSQTRVGLAPLIALAMPLAATAFIFGLTDLGQALRLSRSKSWRWETYYSFVDCIDRRLTGMEETLHFPKPFRVWGPTFPDVLIELSRRHPDWDFTRTNDFWERAHLAVKHGHDVHAVVVTETLNWAERTIDAPWAEHSQIRSAWMEWRGYFLNRLFNDVSWKPNRHLCQQGRWQGFIFMEKAR